MLVHFGDTVYHWSIYRLKIFISSVGIVMIKFRVYIFFIINISGLTIISYIPWSILTSMRIKSTAHDFFPCYKLHNLFLD